MSELYEYIESNGVILPDTSKIKADVENEYKNALGQNISTAPDSPQGRLISTEVSARRAVALNNALLANQIHPDFASGLFLESICALLDIEREGATASVIPNVRLTGIPLTQIAAGARAKTRNGDIFRTAKTVILNSSGSAEVDFIADEAGPTQCSVGSLNKIIDAVLGWETVYNSNQAIVGKNEQSDTSLRLKRKARLANQGISTVEAQIGELYGIEGVHSLAFLENISDRTEIVDGIKMKPHSIWACVHGGADEAIAKALLNNKTDGAGWNGETTVTIIEENAQIPYTVLFDRPQQVPIDVNVVIRKSIGLADINEAIIDALLAYADGEIDGERGFVVGENVSAFELAGAINIKHPGIFVKQILISRDDDPVTNNEIIINKNEIATLDRANITITIKAD